MELRRWWRVEGLGWVVACLPAHPGDADHHGVDRGESDGCEARHDAVGVVLGVVGKQAHVPDHGDAHLDRNGQASHDEGEAPLGVERTPGCHGHGDGEQQTLGDVLPAVGGQVVGPVGLEIQEHHEGDHDDPEAGAEDVVAAEQRTGREAGDEVEGVHERTFRPLQDKSGGAETVLSKNRFLSIFWRRNLDKNRFSVFLW